MWMHRISLEYLVDSELTLRNCVQHSWCVQQASYQYQELPAFQTPTLRMETDAADAPQQMQRLMCVTAANKSKRICLQYRQYGSQLRASMARYSDLYGLQAASRHFSSKLGHKVPYTTIPCSRTLLLAAYTKFRYRLTFGTS